MDESRVPDPGLTARRWAPGSQHRTPRGTRSVCLAGAGLQGLLKPSGPRRPGPANTSLTHLRPRDRGPATWTFRPRHGLPRGRHCRQRLRLHTDALPSLTACRRLPGRRYSRKTDRTRTSQSRKLPGLRSNFHSAILLSCDHQPHTGETRACVPRAGVTGPTRVEMQLSQELV